MLGVKLLGSLIVLAAAGGLGAVKSMEYTGRIHCLAEMRRLFLLLDGEIRSSRTPISDAFLHMSSRMSGIYKDFLEEMAEQISQMNGENFSGLWRNSLKKHLGEGKTALKKEDLDLLASFGDMFGYLDTRMQLDAIKLLQEQLLDLMSRLSGSCTSQIRMARLLGVSGGIFLVILLL